MEHGEWFIDESGSTTYADGDVGVAGHQRVAWESFFGISEDDAYKLPDEVKEALFYEIGSVDFAALGEYYSELENIEVEEDDDSKFIELGRKYFSELGGNLELVDYSDPRDYAMEKHGWIRVVNDRFQTWVFDADALDRIQNFESWEEEDESDENSYATIEELSTGKYFEIPYNELLAAKTVFDVTREATPEMAIKPKIVPYTGIPSRSRPGETKWEYGIGDNPEEEPTEFPDVRWIKSQHKPFQVTVISRDKVKEHRDAHPGMVDHMQTWRIREVLPDGLIVESYHNPIFAHKQTTPFYITLSEAKRFPKRRSHAENPLLVTPFMKLWMRDMKVTAVVKMDPRAFLDLTTTDSSHAHEIKEEALPLDKYNEFAAKKESGIPPFLKIDLSENEPWLGKVIGHEGRHRSAALVANGEFTMSVAIILARDYVSSRKFTALDIPLQWKGEYKRDYEPYFKIFTFLQGIERANVQEEYQENPPIDDAPLTIEEFKTLLMEKKNV